MLLLTNKTIEKLQHDLVREGLIDIEGLNFAQENCQKNKSNLAEELVNENLISEIELLNFIENKLHVPYVNLKDYEPDTSCLKYVNATDAIKHNIFPLFKIENVLTIAMADPLDLFTINTLFELKNISIEPVVSSEKAIKKAINKYYYNEDIDNKTLSWQDKILSDNITDDIINDTVNEIISDAISCKSNNIYIESFQNGLNIYFNKDLKGFIPNLITKRFLLELTRIANIDIELNDVPQTSKFNFNNFYIRAGFFPIKSGVRIALNINKKSLDFDKFKHLSNKIFKIIDKSSFNAILSQDENFSTEFIYSFAEYLGEKYSVLMVENKIGYEVNNVTQYEFNKNTALYFDEILNQIEFQKFDIIFWDKIYTNEQFEKLKLFANEKKIIIHSFVGNLDDFDNILYLDDYIKK